MQSKALFSLVLIGTLAAPTLVSAQYSAALKNACRNDYKRFCGEFAPQDAGLRQCMDRAGESLTKRCVEALIDAGEISRERAARRWKHQ